MILLRFLSILAGALVLVAPPLFLFSGTSGPGAFDVRTVLLMIAGLAAVATSFFFVGFAGGRMKRSPKVRTTGAALLTIPFTACIAVLARTHQPDVLWLSGLLLTLTLMLFVSVLFPGAGAGKHRSMRARESRPGQLARG